LGLRGGVSVAAQFRARRRRGREGGAAAASH
jgi:hypothetical protein